LEEYIAVAASCQECDTMETVLSPPERLVILTGVSWETYERLLAEHVESSGPRFTYDEGMLQIMVLSSRHEKPNRTLALLVEVIAEELGLDIERLGSTTFKREDLLKGFEPDSCFYIQRADEIEGKDKVDLAVDPPPDLVIEIDITSDSLDRFPIFAAVGVPEVWRFDGTHVEISRLEEGNYVKVDRSISLSVLTGDVATRFLEESKTEKSTVWLRRVREWVRNERS
jgi:Uma2 family endonuclease